MTADTTFMRREIEEIPEAVARLWERSRDAVEEAGRRLREADPLFLATVARGSSDHAATLLKYAVEIALGVPVASIGPSVASVYGARLRLERAGAVAVSQSGRSPDIVAMAEAARAGGALTVAITNDPGSPLARAVALPIDIASGPERSVAATKTFVASAAAGLGLVAAWRNDAALWNALVGLPEALERAIACDWSAFGAALSGDPSLFVLGRGPAIAVAGEAALKFKETCNMHAESYSAAEVMHGPLALLAPGFPVLALAARDQAEPHVAEAADSLAGKGAAVFATTGRVGKATALPFAATGHPLTDPLSLVTSFYGFAEALARSRGLDPDQPPHLKKVTETR
jgi:glutamine---fructose-6-phosphate transaminase (isomerizing)